MPRSARFSSRYRWQMSARQRVSRQYAGYALAALLIGVVLGYASLVAGPIGQLAFLTSAAVIAASSRRAAMLGPLLLGAGLTGAWLLSPALTNTDPAVNYPAETGLIPFIAYAVVAVCGLAMTAFSLRSLYRGGGAHRAGLADS
jgi:hypothetical protein